jgi:ADP-heptose:LPS heptosyltransferase
MPHPELAQPAEQSVRTRWLIVSIKALGDFVMALRSLQGIEASQWPSPQILAAEHLRDFAAAMGALERVKFMDCGTDYPAAWDFRRRGLFAGVRSIRDLRPRFAALPPDYGLVFDIFSWRERFLATSHRACGLVRAPNIYQAFERTLEGLGFRSNRPARPAAGPVLKPGVARLYAASRVQAKTIPGAVIERAVRQLAAAGIECEVIALGNEPLQVAASVPVRRIERNFTALLDSIRTSALVVSADSLPAHIADYFGLPTHVISPKENTYWLPAGVFRQAAWSLFADAPAFTDWVARMKAESGA